MPLHESTCPTCGGFNPDTCIPCDDLDRERNDGRSIDRG